MASEGNISLVHEGTDHMSIHSNGQVSSEQSDTLEQQQNIVEVTVTNKLKEESPTVVVKKTVSLRMQSTIVNGVPLESTEFVEDTVAPAEMENVPILLPMKGPENTAVAADDKRLIQESELVAVEKTPAFVQMEPNFDSGVAEGNEEEEISGEISVSEPGAEDAPDAHEDEHLRNSNELGNYKEGEKALDRRDTIEETSPIAIEKTPASLHMEHVSHEQGSTDVQEPIEEASAIAVESEPRVCDYHPMLEETEDKSVDCNSMEVEYAPAATTQNNEEETVSETKEIIAEECPLVVEKRPVSLHVEDVFDHKEDEEVRKPIKEVPHEIIEKRPVSLHMEQIFNGEGGFEVQEAIEEAFAVAVESEPRVCDYHPMLEETEEKENVDGNSVEVEYETAAMTPGSEEEMERTDTRETITETSPLVVEKRPVSLHVEATFDHKEDEQVRKPIEEAPHEIIEKRPASLHMEQIFSEEGNNEVQVPIEEASAIAVESEPRVCDYHPMLEETVEDENVDGNSVEVEYEPAVMTSGNKDGMETKTNETIAEESPLVIEKRPVSLHMEAAFDLKEDEEDRKPREEVPHEVIEKRSVSLHMGQMFNEEGSDEVQEPIEEASAVAVESEPRLFDYHPMLEERTEDENVHGNSVEVEYEPFASTADTKEEAKTEIGPRETVAEEYPLVIEKRPVSLHIKAAFDDKEDVEERIKEDPPQIIEKRPVSLHMENILDESVVSVVQEPVEEVSAVAVESELRVREYHPMLEETVEDENVDGNCVEVEYEPTVTTLENEEETVSKTEKMIAEESPLVFEKRPVSLHLEAVFEHKEEGKVEEPIKEAPLEIIKKRPVSLRMEQMFNEEENAEVREPIEEASALAVESEPRVYDYHPMLEVAVEDENVDGNSVEVEYEPAAMKLNLEGETETEAKDAITEEFPLVVEKRPASVHMEAVFIPKEEVKEPIEEAPHEIIEKRPVSLHVEQVFNDEGSPEIQRPTEEASAVAVETEPRSFHYHPMLEEKAEDRNVYTKSVEVEYEPAAAKHEEETKTDTRETIAEESPLVVETRPASLQLEVLVDYEKGSEVVKPIEETPPIVVDKTPTDNSQKNESIAKEEPEWSVHVLDLPEVEKVKEVEDSVQEAVAPAVERKVPEFHHELLQTVETEDGKPEDTTLEVKAEEKQVRETEILDDEVQVPELKGNEVQESKRNEVITKTEVISTVTINQRTGDETSHDMETNVVQTTYEKKTMEYSNTSTTEETFTSTSFTKLNQHGRDDDDDELLRHVLRKRLSAPEVLPEKENDGSAPLAASEDRGILESQEQFAFVDNSRKKDSTPINKPQMSGATPFETEPYEDVADEKKLIADAPGEAEVAVDDSMENEERAGESLPVLLLLTPEEEKDDHENERKKGKASGPSQCKCCSLM